MNEAVIAALGRWLAENVAGVDSPDISIEVLAGGASNLTIGIEAGSETLVVRRPPIGAFLPSANDVSREYRFLRALRNTPVPVPEVYAYCQDSSVIGAPFYVMERLWGVVPHDDSVLGALTPEQGRALSIRFVDVLKAIHAVQVDAVGLGGIAKPSGYLQRQLARWTDQWRRARLEESPAIDELAERLASRIPPSTMTTIVHGDYRLGNVMVGATDPTEIIGVFDWEMATLGDPLADVGYTLLYWGTQDRPPIHPSQVIPDRPGFLNAADLIAAYGAVADLTFYIALAAFKLAIIGEGIRERARRLGEPVSKVSDPLPGWALDLLGHSTSAERTGGQGAASVTSAPRCDRQP